MDSRWRDEASWKRLRKFEHLSMFLFVPASSDHPFLGDADFNPDELVKFSLCGRRGDDMKEMTILESATSQAEGGATTCKLQVMLFHRKNHGPLSNYKPLASIGFSIIPKIRFRRFAYVRCWSVWFVLSH